MSASIYKEAKKLGWSGADIYIPNADKYPHLHVSKEHCTFSTSATSHKPLAKGASLLKANAKSVLGSISDADAKSLIQSIIDG